MKQDGGSDPQSRKKKQSAAERRALRKNGAEQRREARKKSAPHKRNAEQKREQRRRKKAARLPAAAKLGEVLYRKNLPERSADGAPPRVFCMVSARYPKWIVAEDSPPPEEKNIRREEKKNTLYRKEQKEKGENSPLLEKSPPSDPRSSAIDLTVTEEGIRRFEDFYRSLFLALIAAAEAEVGKETSEDREKEKSEGKDEDRREQKYEEKPLFAIRGGFRQTLRVQVECRAAAERSAPKRSAPKASRYGSETSSGSAAPRVLAVVREEKIFSSGREIFARRSTDRFSLPDLFLLPERKPFSGKTKKKDPPEK